MQTHSIPEAAKILKVTDKTIRNYIDRGFLKPEKWNGSWRISKNEISELFWKKFGNHLDSESDKKANAINQIVLAKSDYEDQQRQLGRLSALEQNERDLKGVNRDLVEKNAQLEASSASGWTQSRALQEELERLREELAIAKESERKALQDSEWLRRELEEVRLNAENGRKTLQQLQHGNQRLSEQLLEKSLGL